jgi:hypothetical protein
VPKYEIRVIGSLGPAPAQAFAGLVVHVGPSVTVVSGDLDRLGLQVLLNRMYAMGLELVSLKREPNV